MSDKLPNFIDPLLLAERRGIFAGALKISDFDRLSELVVAGDGLVDIDVVFTKEGKQPVVIGNVKAVLQLVCQSCLQSFNWSIDINFKLGVVASLLEADKLEIDCEPLLFNGEKISLREIIEDEILLALPDYPRHDFDCMQRGNIVNGDNNKQDNPARAENPFAVLAKLKKTGD